jgi:RNA polymerase sigma factor (sigma-70 family)
MPFEKIDIHGTVVRCDVPEQNGKPDEIVEEAPEYSDRNMGLYQPVLAVRKQIAMQWNDVMGFMDDLGIERRASKDEKILAADVSCGVLKKEISRILGQKFQTRAKAGRLILLLGCIDEDRVRFERLRADFAEENMGVAGDFIKRKGHYYSRVDIDDKAQAARLGVLRAAETWNQERGNFSTYANVWMRRGLSIMGKENRKHEIPSLDRPLKGKHGSGKGSLLDLVTSTRENQPDHSVLYMMEKDVLRGVIENLDPVYKRLAELRWLDGGNRRNVSEIAEVLNQEGFTTLRTGSSITENKVRQWLKLLERMVIRDMKKKIRQDAD